MVVRESVCHEVPSAKVSKDFQGRDGVHLAKCAQAM